MALKGMEGICNNSIPRAIGFKTEILNVAKTTQCQPQRGQSYRLKHYKAMPIPCTGIPFAIFTRDYIEINSEVLVIDQSCLIRDTLSMTTTLCHS